LSLAGVPDGKGLHFEDYAIGPITDRQAQSSTAQVLNRKQILFELRSGLHSLGNATENFSELKMLMSVS
jgi:hypothetical protein